MNNFVNFSKFSKIWDVSQTWLKYRSFKKRIMKKCLEVFEKFKFQFFFQKIFYIGKIYFLSKKVIEKYFIRDRKKYFFYFFNISKTKNFLNFILIFSNQSFLDLSKSRQIFSKFEKLKKLWDDENFQKNDFFRFFDFSPKKSKNRLLFLSLIIRDRKKSKKSHFICWEFAFISEDVKTKYFFFEFSKNVIFE